MDTRELYTTAPRTAQLLLDVWDSYTEQIGHQQRRLPPIGRLIFELTEQLGAQGFVALSAPRRLVVKQNPSGVYLFFGLFRLPQDAQHIEYSLEPGTYRLRISHREGFYQTMTLAVTIPTSAVPYRIPLEPGATYPYLPTSTGVRGRVIDSTRPYPDDGVAGVRITVKDFPCSALTDRDGGWVYYFPEPDRTQSLPGNVEVKFRHPEDNREATDVVSITAKKLNLANDFEF